VVPTRSGSTHNCKSTQTNIRELTRSGKQAASTDVTSPVMTERGAEQVRGRDKVKNIRGDTGIVTVVLMGRGSTDELRWNSLVM